MISLNGNQKKENHKLHAKKHKLLYDPSQRYQDYRNHSKKPKVPKNQIGFCNHGQSFTTLYYLDVESSLVENLKIGWKQIETD